MLVCDICSKSSWAKVHVCEWGRDGVMFMCAHVYDVPSFFLVIDQNVFEMVEEN